MSFNDLIITVPTPLVMYSIGWGFLDSFTLQLPYLEQVNDSIVIVTLTAPILKSNLSYPFPSGYRSFPFFFEGIQIYSDHLTPFEKEPVYTRECPVLVKILNPPPQILKIFISVGIVRRVRRYYFVVWRTELVVFTQKSIKTSDLSGSSYRSSQVKEHSRDRDRTFTGGRMIQECM